MRKWWLKILAFYGFILKRNVKFEEMPNDIYFKTKVLKLRGKK